MKYPLYNNWLDIQKIKGMNLVIVRDYGKDKLSFVSQQDIENSRRIDGHDPYRLFGSCTRKEVDRYLNYLLDVGLIRNNHFIRTGKISAHITILTPRQKMSQMICKKYASALSFVFGPLFVLGALLGGGQIYMWGIPHITGWVWNVGILLGLIIGASLHELSHGIMAWAYGAKLYEAGITLIPIPGAYVLIDDDMIDSKGRIQILAAGIEMNLLVFGISMIIFYVCNISIFAVVGLMNLALAVENMMIIPGLDGYAIMKQVMEKYK